MLKVKAARLCYNIEGDRISWGGILIDGAVMVKETYSFLISRDKDTELSNDFWPFWHQAIPTKIILFSWLLWKNQILTWDLIKHRGFQRPGRCALCKNDYESARHLLFLCPMALQIWDVFTPHFTNSSWVP